MFPESISNDVFREPRANFLLSLSVFLLSMSVLSDVFGAVDKTSSSFSAHGKIGNFINFIIISLFHVRLILRMSAYRISSNKSRVSNTSRVSGV